MKLAIQYGDGKATYATGLQTRCALHAQKRREHQIDKSKKFIRVVLGEGLCSDCRCLYNIMRCEGKCPRCVSSIKKVLGWAGGHAQKHYRNISAAERDMETGERDVATFPFKDANRLIKG